MAKKCIVPGCGKELADEAKAPVCEYHKGVTKDRAKGVGLAVMGIVGMGLLAAKDKIGPIVAEKAHPAARRIAKLVTRH